MARSRAIGIDPERLRNVLHIPSDAGPHARAIEAILRRIPDGWERWLNVDDGWYPLVITTDHRLAEHDSGYVVHRIKRKYGMLRYYYWPGSDVAPDLLDATDAITDEAERVSAVTCERCGQSGTLHRTLHGWVKTLCPMCATDLGYGP